MWGRDTDRDTGGANGLLRLIVLAGLGLCAVPVRAQPQSNPDITKLIDEARALQQHGSLSEAQAEFESLLPVLKAKAMNTDLADVLNDLSQLAVARGSYGDAVAWARQAADLYRKLKDERGRAHALNNAGVAELYRGRYEDAKAQFLAALHFHQAVGDADGEVEVLNNLGSVAYFEGDYLQAFRRYEDAFGRVEASGDQPWTARRRQISLVNMATLYQRLGRGERAIEIYQRLQNSRTALSASEEARLLANLGALNRRLGDPWKALADYRRAQALFMQDHHTDGEIGVLKNIGIALALDLGDLEGALAVFKRALSLAEQTDDRREAMQAHLYLGEALYRLKKHEAARQEFEIALAGAKKMGAIDEQWKGLYGLGKVSEVGGEGDPAEYYRQAVALIESVRAGLQLNTLRSEFLADKRQVYDALIERSWQGGDPSELFSFTERSRSRVFQDQLRDRGRSGLLPGGMPPTLKEAQSALDAATVLVEFWITSSNLGALWITRDGSCDQNWLVPGRSAGAVSVSDSACRALSELVITFSASRQHPARRLGHGR